MESYNRRQSRELRLLASAVNAGMTGDFNALPKPPRPAGAPDSDQFDRTPWGVPA